MSAAYDVASYIAATLAQGALGTDVFVNLMPDTPDSAIAVYEYGGGQSALGMGNANADALEHVSIQVAVRRATLGAAHPVAYTIYKALDGKGGLTINAVQYLFILAMQPPFLMERDEKERETFVFNMQVQKRRS